ncbi:hypothetical protein K1719_047274 [Acacia pycnantha]|nr:hypothetical protein K1719_047274 [Acacia pycnantha]
MASTVLGLATSNPLGTSRTCFVPSFPSILDLEEVVRILGVVRLYPSRCRLGFFDASVDPTGEESEDEVILWVLAVARIAGFTESQVDFRSIFPDKKIAWSM